MQPLWKSLALTTVLCSVTACGAHHDSDTQAIAKFVAAEDEGFASERGATRGDAGGLHYYESSLGLPGASNCAVYTTSSGAYAFGTCDFLAADAAEARRIYDVWKDNTKTAEPSWKTAEPKRPADGHLAAFQAADDKKHAVYLYIAKDPGTYRVTETFGTTDAFGSR
jgi:hypothetical protein